MPSGSPTILLLLCILPSLLKSHCFRATTQWKQQPDWELGFRPTTRFGYRSGHCLSTPVSWWRRGTALARGSLVGGRTPKPILQEHPLCPQRNIAMKIDEFILFCSSLLKFIDGKITKLSWKRPARPPYLPAAGPPTAGRVCCSKHSGNSGWRKRTWSSRALMLSLWKRCRCWTYSKNVKVASL